MASAKKIKAIKVMGLFILISGILYLLYSAVFAYAFFVAQAGILQFWSFWYAFPTLLIGFYKVRIGIAVTKRRPDYLRLMLFLIGVIDGLFGFFIQQRIPKTAFLMYLIFLYLLPLVLLRNFGDTTPNSSAGSTEK